MDEATLKVFKMKFVKLTVILNIVIFLAALTIIAAAGIIPVYSLEIAVACAIGTLLSALYFRKEYMTEKAWLDTQK